MQRIQINQLLMAAAIAASLAGCTRDEPGPTKAAFLHDPAQLKETLNWCKNNPAERQGAAKCINASSAITSQGMLPCFDKGQVNHACLEEHGYPR